MEQIIVTSNLTPVIELQPVAKLAYLGAYIGCSDTKKVIHSMNKQMN